MYLDLYHLKHDPFPTKSAAPLLYMSPNHSAALARVMDAITERRGFMALIGEVGIGKTSLLRSQLAQTQQHQLKVIYLPQADMSFEKLVKSIYSELGVESPLGSLPEMVAQLQELFVKEHTKGRNVVLVIDNAHKIPVDTLRNVSLLSNRDDATEKVLQIVLVAQPHIIPLLRAFELINTDNQGATVSYLDRFSFRESVCYIQEQIAHAQDNDVPVFSKGTIRTIVKYTKGVPLRINILCTEILAYGNQAQIRPIPPSIARRVIAEFAGLPSPSRVRPLIVGAAGVLLVAGLVASVHYSKVFDSLQAAKDVVPQSAPVVRHAAPPVATRDSAIDPAPAVAQQRAEAPAESGETQGAIEVSSETLSPAKASEAPRTSVVAAPVAAPGQLAQPSPSVARQERPPVLDNRPDAVRQAKSLIRQYVPNGGDFRLNVWTEEREKTVYREGERLVVHVLAETDAYLWVDYYQANGQVVHLLPNPLDNNRVVAGETFSLGQPQSSFRFDISPPFGAETLIVIASQRPFALQQGKPNIEAVGEYMHRLQQNLNEYTSRGKVAVAHIDLLTQKH